MSEEREMEDEPQRGRLAAFTSQLGGKLGVAVSIVGFIVIFLGWNGAASFNDLRQQFPYVISGGIAGLALVVLGAALLLIESARAERAELQGSIDDLRRAVEAMSGAGADGGGSVTASAVGGDMVVAGTSSYHRPECRLVQGRERVNLITTGEADAAGLAPCRICNPAA